MSGFFKRLVGFSGPDLPDTAAGPTEDDEVAVLAELYGPPVNGVFRDEGFHADDISALIFDAPAELLAAGGVKDLLSKARSYLGTTGRPNRFTRWYAGRNGNGFLSASWCDMFVTYVAFASGNAKVCNPKGDRAYTVWHAEDGIRLGRYYLGTTGSVVKYCKPGAIVFFDWGGSNNTGAIDHVGFCELNLHDGRLQTIEGNTSDSVRRRVRDSSVIAGFWVPDFPAGPKSGPTPEPVPSGSVPLPVPRLAVDGAIGPLTIRALQRVLNFRARSNVLPILSGNLGSYTVRALQRYLRVTPDGELGPVTVRALQRHLRGVEPHLAIDGELGPLTVKALQSALNSGRF